MEHYVGAVVAWRREARVPNFIAALIIFVIGWTVSTVIRGIRRRVLARGSFDETLALFSSRLA